MDMRSRQELLSFAPTGSPIATIDIHTRLRIYSDMEGEMSYQSAQESSLIEPSLPRKSARLQSMGYYNDDGRPKIVYKERLRTVFKRRRRATHTTHPDPLRAHAMVGDPTFRHSWVIFVLFFIAVFGYAVTTYVMDHLMTKSLRNYGESLWFTGRDMRDLKKDLTELRQKLRPQADTLPNFALDVHGAYVVADLTSETYESEGMIWGRKSNAPWLKYKTPCNVISSHSNPLIPGHCWPFRREKGYLFISLAHKIHITHVSLGHISRDQSPTGQTLGAPKRFTVYGLNMLRGEETKLGTFEYDNKGDSFQTFEILNHRDKVFQYVRLEVESNYGDPTYTCLYNFKVHGHMP